MTRRFGIGYIGAILSLVPVAGCAGWGRSAAVTGTNSETPSLLDSWCGPRRQHVNPAQPVETDAAPLVHETKVPSPPEPPDTSPKASQASDRIEPLPLDPPIVFPAPTKEATDPVPAETATLPIPLPPTAGPATMAAPQVIQHEPLVDAMQAFIDNRQSEALQLLRKYEAPTQEVFLRLLPVLALMTQKSLDQLSAPEIAVLNEQLRGLNEALRPRSKLAIENACFCEWIKSFGDYKPLPKDYAFSAATPNRPGEYVQTYVALRNFASVPTNGFYVTRLAVSIEILDQRRKHVWGYSYEDQTIRSRDPSNDHCDNYAFPVPSELAPGTYTLIIRVKDKTLANQPREASQALEFRVTSMPRMP